MKKKAWSGTGRRLFVAFASMVALYAVAASFALYGLVDIQRGLTRTRERVEGLRLALELSSAVRDQYAHVAHTIIIGNDSHLGFYDRSKKRAHELTGEMRRFAAGDDERQWVSEIERSTRELDQSFRDRVVPGVLQGKAELVQEEHHKVLEAMARVQDHTELLARRFSESVEELRVFVSGLQQRALVWTILFLMVAPTLAAGAGIVIGRSVADPVAKLRSGAERIAGGDLDTRIEIESQDEFGALAGQFNTMAAAIKQHQQERLQNERLAGIGRLAAGVAHEINNPLGVILGYVKILGKKAEGTLAEDLKVIEEETLRCKEIVDGLLDLSRPIKLGDDAVDLREVADDVVARLTASELAPAAPITVNGQAAVQGDARKLRQVVFNLVKNAVEAAGASGRVEVQLAQQDDRVELVVCDTGPGFEPAAREHLFEPFFTTKQRGTGLGLAVSSAIARAHGGEIRVAAPEAGARLALCLPRARQGGTP
ncbi:MAG: HAMP domain-containing protein [Deltaproteobacteria bacterium]|nr:HAMP domain-containing protein [Deltaproteobacteria bacterium]